MSKFTRSVKEGDVGIDIEQEFGGASGTIKFPADWPLEKCLKEIPKLNPILRQELGNIDKLSIEMSKHTRVNDTDLGDFMAKHFDKMKIEIVYGEVIKWWLCDHPDCRVVTISGSLT